MVRYTDENGKVHELERCPMMDPTRDIYNLARGKAERFGKFDRRIQDEIISMAVWYFVYTKRGTPAPHLKDANADALLQDVIEEYSRTYSRASGETCEGVTK